MESVWSVSKLSTESVGSRRELCSPTRQNSFDRLDSFVSSASAVCIGLKVMILLASCVVAGMSTCPEVIVARHGQRPMGCLGLSLVSNMCVMDYDCHKVATHDKVLEVAHQRVDDLRRFVSALMARVSL